MQRRTLEGTLEEQCEFLYQLAREPDAVRERTVEITFLGANAEGYAFTFG